MKRTAPDAEQSSIEHHELSSNEKLHSAGDECERREDTLTKCIVAKILRCLSS